MWLAPFEAWEQQLRNGYENNDEVLLLALRRLGLDLLAKAGVDEQAIERICSEAIQHGFYSVCEHSGWVPVCRRLLGDSNVTIAAVCGFPFGADVTEMKAQDRAIRAEEQIRFFVLTGKRIDEWAERRFFYILTIG
jgi:hypothetical protein